MVSLRDEIEELRERLRVLNDEKKSLEELNSLKAEIQSTEAALVTLKRSLGTDVEPPPSTKKKTWDDDLPPPEVREGLCHQLMTAILTNQACRDIHDATQLVINDCSADELTTFFKNHFRQLYPKVHTITLNNNHRPLWYALPGASSQTTLTIT